MLCLDCLGEVVGEVFVPVWDDDDVEVFEAIRDLVEMNDTGKSFAEIADWIEENL